MALGSSHWSKYGNKCICCGSTEKLTRHHIVKNGKRTGEIIVLCSECHEKINREEP